MEKNKIQFGNYAVAYLDLLNQKETLASMNSLPSNQPEIEAFTDKLKKTYGKVKAFRSNFDKLYDGYNQASSNSPLNAIADFIPRLKQFRGRVLKKHCFSDTVVYYSPLMGSNEYFGISNIYSLIAPIASLQLLTLAAGSVFRGGIEIGIGGEYFENEIYGNAFYNAYHLENEVAGYPRIVIGKGLYEYVYIHSQLPGDDLSSNYQRTISKLCLAFIKTDHDKEYVINPICDQVKRMAGSRFNEIHMMALLFVKNELIRFKTTDQKLFIRYQNLINLLEL